MSGSSGIGTHAVARDSTPFLTVADDQNVSSLLAGTAWNGTSITYSFSPPGSFYGTQASYGDPAPLNGFSPLDSAGDPRPPPQGFRPFRPIAKYTAPAVTPDPQKATKPPT